MKLRALLTEYNWLISALIVIIGTPIMSLIQSGQPITLQGVILAVVPAAINYYTTHSAEKTGTEVGIQVGKEQAIHELVSGNTEAGNNF